jgi:hypothetical protein
VFEFDHDFAIFPPTIVSWTRDNTLWLLYLYDFRDENISVACPASSAGTVVIASAVSEPDIAHGKDSTVRTAEGAVCKSDWNLRQDVDDGKERSSRLPWRNSQ